MKLISQHQISHATKKNRYEDIFLFCAKIFSNAKNILSFGCSIGEEALSLKENYFKNSAIDGLDISDNVINICKSKNKYKDVNFFTYKDFDENKKYDIIFCMSVLCRWPDTKILNDCSKVYSFSQFNEQLNELDKILNINGIIVIYNANFCFSDSLIYKNYQIIDKIKESGFVKKFDINNKALNTQYPYCIFKKVK